MQELASLQRNMPLSQASSMFLLVDDDRPDVMRLLITGPKDTPYSYGAFQFDVFCPATYPNNPPLVNLQTTGYGAVRFNPNLYANGKVCLSLIGTWRGEESERWNAKTSTLLQVFVSIQSLILVPDPWFNEPGYETEMHTEVGRDNSRAYNRNLRLQTLRYAVLEQLKKPSPGFEEVIKKHFTLVRKQVYALAKAWQAEAASQISVSTKVNAGFDQVVKDLKVLIYLFVYIYIYIVIFVCSRFFFF